MAALSRVSDELVRRRIRATFCFVVVLYIVLVIRLVLLQVAQGTSLRDEAIRNREHRIPIRSHRGAILDRDNKPLALSIYSGTVSFDPSAAQPTAKPKDNLRRQQRLEAGITRVAAALRMPRADLEEIVHKAVAAPFVLRGSKLAPVKYVLIKKGVSLDQAEAIRNSQPLGFGVVEGATRAYAAADDACQLIGYTNARGIGVAGLERTYGHWLDGHDGFAVAQLDVQNREIPDTRLKMVPSRGGFDVHTTIDSNAQHIITEETRKVFDKYHPKGISAIAVDPMTGNILAMVSMPTFDPNPDKRRMLKTGNGCLTERCAAQLYEPGSTLKALALAAALNEGVITTESTFFCSGKITVAGREIHCALHGPDEVHGHGLERPIDIMRHSCNVGAAEVGMRLGPKRLYAAEKRFGLLDKAGSGLPAEQRGRLSFDKREKIYTMAKAARVAFGHSITTTPLNVVMAYTSLVNGGILRKAQLIASVTDSSGKVIKKFAQDAGRRVISQDVSRTMCEMLRAVVTSGTGRVAAVPGFEVGGKTGTANKYRRGAYVGSFIGYLPASPEVKPRVVVLVAVDEPQGGYYGAEVAAPAFQAIARRLMSYWRVPEDDPNCIQAKAAAPKTLRAAAAASAMAQKD